MKNLSKPLKNAKPEDIFEECVNGYNNAEKRQKLISCKNLIQIDSKACDEYIPHRANEFSKSTIPAGIANSDISSVYTEKFVPQGSPGRKYYNAIMEQAVRGVCPICGVRIAYTLDHYLPKSKVPTLSVTPNNLIPACRDCNMDKQADLSYNPLDMPVHLYYDAIPNEPWLFVKFKDNLEAIYYISCQDSWEIGLRSRLEKHLDFYNLHTLYSSHAAQEIADRMMSWKDLVNRAGFEQLKEYIDRECQSIENNDINSWKAALYRGLVSDFDILKKYLQSM